MVCPFYVDFTRMCIEKLPRLVKFTSLQRCDSEQYADCLIYQVYYSDFFCKYFYDCANQYIEKMPKELMAEYMGKEASKVANDICKNYCLSPEKSKICAKYQLLSKGETPPADLQPDGNIIIPFDLIFRRKLFIPPQK